MMYPAVVMVLASLLKSKGTILGSGAACMHARISRLIIFLA